GYLVADAADAELAELREVLADLRRRELVVVRQLGRRHPLHPPCPQLLQAPQVERQAVEGERGGLSHGAPIARSSQARMPLGQTPSSSEPPAATSTARRPQPSMGSGPGAATSGFM